MAKPATPAAASPFKIETGVALPAIARAAGGTSSPYVPAMKGLQLATDPKKLQSFFIPVGDAPPTITVDTEKTAWAKEEARKIANRVSGISRRLVKADATLAFAIRSMADANGKMGVRVFRVTPAEKTAAA